MEDFSEYRNEIILLFMAAYVVFLFWKRPMKNIRENAMECFVHSVLLF